MRRAGRSRSAGPVAPPRLDVVEGRSGAPALEAVDVTRSYSLDGVTVEALRGVSMTVERGDYAAVVGPSGSGKSTLMHLLGGLDRPTTGVLRVDGRDIAELSEDELASVRNATIGFVFQAFQLLGRTSAVDNVAMPLVYRGLRRSERRRRAREALERVGMGHRLDHRPGQLSGGEQQRVAIARALVGDPQVLLADEPTGNLDTRTGEEVMALLEQLNREQGVAVVLVTHDREVAARAFRQIRVRDGLLEGEPQTAVTRAPATPPPSTPPPSPPASSTPPPSAPASSEHPQHSDAGDLPKISTEAEPGPGSGSARTLRPPARRRSARSRVVRPDGGAT